MKKVTKVILKILLVFVVLFLLIVFSLQVPFVQNLVKDKAVTFLEDKINTKVEVGSIEIGLPKKIILHNFYFEDQSKDTLLAGEFLKVDINFFELFRNKIVINSINLKKIIANVEMNKDSVYNFDYIIKAFETSEKSKNETKATDISIKKIKLGGVNFKYNNAVSKNAVTAYVKDFNTEITKFDLENLTFNIPEINLNGLKLYLNQDLIEGVKIKTTKTINNASNKTLKLNLENIQLEKIDLIYNNAIKQIATKITFEKLQTNVKSIDLEKQTIALNSIKLKKTNGKLTLGKTTKKTDESSSIFPWKIDINSIFIDDFNYAFDNNNVNKIQQGIDYNHLSLSDLYLKATSISLNNNSYNGTINSFQFKEKSGFKLDALTTNFSYTNNGASLKNLYLKTPQTILQNYVTLTYPSINSISNNPKKLTLNVELKDSKIGFKDVLLLIPQLNTNKVLKNNSNTIVNINTSITGKLNSLKINKFNAKGIGNTNVHLNGNVTGLPNIDTSLFDINIINFESSAEDAYTFTPKNTIPENIQLPEKLNLKGYFKGNIFSFETNLTLKSSLGNANIEAHLDRTQKNNEKYTVNTIIENLNLGTLLKNKQFGKVTANAIVNGTSLSPANVNATLSSKIINIQFNNYKYQNIAINGDIKKEMFTANTAITDTNLTFVLDTKGSYKREKPTLDLNLNLDIINLKELNFSTSPLKIKGNITANFEDLNLNNLNGTIHTNDFLVALEKEQFPVDKINIKAVSTAEKDSIILNSKIANGLIIGDYKLTTVSSQLMNSISKYYQLNKEYTKNEENQKLDFKFVINKNSIIKKIFPKIIELSEISIAGAYNSINDSIVVNATIPKLNYANNEISNGLLKVNSKENRLLYNLSLVSLKNEQFQIPKTTLIGKIEGNIIDYKLNIKDFKNKDKFLISGIFKDNLETYVAHINPEKLLLNYQDWNIDKNNIIKFDKNGLLISNFKIQNNQQLFSVQSKNNITNAPISINLENFKLESLTSITKSNFEIGGTINGETTIKKATKNPLFVADLNIENFKIKKDTVGNLAIKIDNKTSNIYETTIKLTGLNSQLNINGNYNISNQDLDFLIDLKKLQMRSVQPFTFNNLKESNGYLNGKLNITGKVKSPNVKGAIKFNSVGFLVVPLNSKFQLLNDEIVFNNNKIIFKDFKLQDDNNNPLKINGSINSKDYTNVGFNLNVIADNFKTVNSKAKNNDLFYGELYLNNNLDIKGTLDNPIINGTVKINADTKFNIVLPQSDPSVADREGIVEFIDQDQPVLITIKDPTKQITQTKLEGINASVNITVDKKAEISIIIDEANGDYLKLQGNAELTGGIDPSGKTTLTGKYEFTGGSYEMNFNLIKRKFDIKEGSYILWTGEPTTANINITAIYNVNASPLDLVNNQLSGISNETRNTYKQKIPFETELKMKGELLQPQITFDIVLPDENNSVATEILNTTKVKLEQIRNDEDALNKQVFALLLLNRFIGENPFESESGGTSGAFLVKQSVSKILSQQLNNLADDLIKGFELDFELEATENYSSGEKEEKTDLNVGLSKKLFNDRLKVTIGSSFGLEGTSQQNEQTTTIAGDVTADYLITKDGRYKLRAYRENKYQVALQGQVIETGVAFIITMDYDKFRELFHNKHKATEKSKNNNED